MPFDPVFIVRVGVAEWKRRIFLAVPVTAPTLRTASLLTQSHGTQMIGKCCQGGGGGFRRVLDDTRSLCVTGGKVSLDADRRLPLLSRSYQSFHANLMNETSFPRYQQNFESYEEERKRNVHKTGIFSTGFMELIGIQLPFSLSKSPN